LAGARARRPKAEHAGRKSPLPAGAPHPSRHGSRSGAERRAARRHPKPG
jgi:hypothetical protein